MKKLFTLALIGLFLAIVPQVQAQDVGTAGDEIKISSEIGASQINYVDPMELVETKLVCGGKEEQGTPIAGNALGVDGVQGTGDDGTSGNITIANIPTTATVVEATLYWTVLTDSDDASNKGQNISFDGNPITGTKIGFSLGMTPCFPQANTFAWKADVTSLVPSPGNGTYTVLGFPGGNQIMGDDFTEGASLHIVYMDSASPLVDVVVFEGLAVTNGSVGTLSQTLTGFQANPSGPVSATWFPVIGNGQIASETISFDGSASIDFSNDLLLDGGTSEIPVRGCSYTDAWLVDCFWDDDKPDVSAAIANGDTSVTVNYTLTSDCHSFVAMQLVVTTDPNRADEVCEEGGAYVDLVCPVSGDYRNHGEYMRCVAYAAETFLAEENVFCDEIQSCIVNPRARDKNHDGYPDSGPGS